MAHIDWSLPLATILRQSTREAHESVERNPGAAALIHGELTREQYVRYLEMLWYIYDALEEALDTHAEDPSLKQIYDPSLFRRAPALAEDIAYFLQVPLSSWLLAHKNCAIPTRPAALAKYIARLRALTLITDPTPLLAHAYVRYLGDLSGGQIIRWKVAKAFKLDVADGLGLKFYQFTAIESSAVDKRREMKQIKEWFQRGLNAAGDLNVGIKAVVCKEANLAFELNAGLFSDIFISSSLKPSEGKNCRNAKVDLLCSGVKGGKTTLLGRMTKVAFFVVSLVYFLLAFA